MPRPYSMPRNKHPIGVPWGNQYLTLLRWLERHKGPKVRTEAQLRRALRQPEVFYILPRKYR